MARKKLKDQRSNNRLKNIQKNLLGVEESAEIMNEVMVALKDTEVQLPTVGSYYTFQYFANTPNLLYDRYPIVAVTGVFEWGFTGVNFHWKEQRNYNYNQMASPLYQAKRNEVDTLLTLPLKYFVQL